jgi:predicted RNase H-like HicB family nuclease
MIRYTIIIERGDDGGYGAWCPDLPGCVALADTEEELLVEMKEAVDFYLEDMITEGLPIPIPSQTVRTATIESSIAA